MSSVKGSVVELDGTPYVIVGEARVREHTNGGELSQVWVPSNLMVSLRTNPDVDIHESNRDAWCLSTKVSHDASKDGLLQLLPGDRVVVLRRP